MSKETYVKLNTAESLKEKGFNWDCEHYYKSNGEIVRTFHTEGSRHINSSVLYEHQCLAPTQAMAMRWFWEEKGLNINAIYGDYPSLKKAYWMPQIDSLDGCYGVDDEDFFREYDSREDCIEAALQYCLTKLI